MCWVPDPQHTPHLGFGGFCVLLSFCKCCRSGLGGWVGLALLGVSQDRAASWGEVRAGARAGSWGHPGAVDLASWGRERAVGKLAPSGFRFPHLLPLRLWVLHPQKFQAVLTKENNIFSFSQENGEGVVEGNARRWASWEGSRPQP